MAGGPNSVRPQHRPIARAPAGDALSGVQRRTRILIRVPTIQLEKPRRLPPTTAAVDAGSVAAEVVRSHVRIDAAHATPAPHFAAPAWLQPASGLIAGILERKSLLALVLIGSGALAIALMNSQSPRDLNSDPPSPNAKAINKALEIDIQPGRPVGDNSIRTADASASTAKLKPNSAELRKSNSEAQSQTRQEIIGPALSPETTSGVSGGLSTQDAIQWRMPAASNLPAALGPAGPRQIPGGTIPALPNYTAPDQVPSPPSGANSDSANIPSGMKAAFRGDIGKIPSTTTQ